MGVARKTWAAGDSASIPYWVYTDEDIYQRELERIWYGAHWLYCGLAVEVPEVGNYRTLTLGQRPVIMVRSSADEISVVENRCAHHGTKICWDRAGKSQELTCPYHQWSYDLTGTLLGVPFRRGIAGKAACPRISRAATTACAG